MRSPADPFELTRFVAAQADVYGAALNEIRAGQKRSHWMWFVFPQVRGLGASSMAVHYALSGVAEARAYLDHGVLGPRLLECCGLVAAIRERPIEMAFPYPDHLKLHSSMTLFCQAAAKPDAFEAVLNAHFAGKPDKATLDILGVG